MDCQKKKIHLGIIKLLFSPIDVIEEYTRPARIKENGQIKTVKALTGKIDFEVEDIGKLEAFLTDGLRTLLDSKLTSDIPTLLEYTIRYPGHSNMVSELIHSGKLDDILQYLTMEKWLIKRNLPLRNCSRNGN